MGHEIVLSAEQQALLSEFSSLIAGARQWREKYSDIIGEEAGRSSGLAREIQREMRYGRVPDSFFDFLPALVAQGKVTTKRGVIHNLDRMAGELWSEFVRPWVAGDELSPRAPEGIHELQKLCALVNPFVEEIEG